MTSPFKKLALAITFSPTGRALLAETIRLKNLFNAELIFIHVGEKNKQTAEKLNDLIEKVGLDAEKTTVIWKSGDPAKVILGVCDSEKIDLLIAGALEKENFIKFYAGSVARRIMREANNSVLIYTSPSEKPKSFSNIFVSTDYSDASKKTINSAYYFALLEQAEKLNIIRDFHIPGLSITVSDSGSISEVENARAKWLEEEKSKMNIFIRELNLREIKVNTVCVYGREGWEAANYVREQNADLYVVNAPTRKFKFLDRLFTHSLEYTFEKLPANLLIVRN